jgi:hypothetical protein
MQRLMTSHFYFLELYIRQALTEQVFAQLAIGVWDRREEYPALSWSDLVA